MTRKNSFRKIILGITVVFICILSACSFEAFKDGFSSGLSGIKGTVESALANSFAKATDLAAAVNGTAMNAETTEIPENENEMLLPPNIPASTQTSMLQESVMISKTLSLSPTGKPATIQSSVKTISPAGTSTPEETEGIIKPLFSTNTPVPTGKAIFTNTPLSKVTNTPDKFVPPLKTISSSVKVSPSKTPSKTKPSFPSNTPYPTFTPFSSETSSKTKPFSPSNTPYPTFTPLSSKTPLRFTETEPNPKFESTESMGKPPIQTATAVIAVVPEKEAPEKTKTDIPTVEIVPIATITKTLVKPTDLPAATETKSETVSIPTVKAIFLTAATELTIKATETKVPEIQISPPSDSELAILKLIPEPIMISEDSGQAEISTSLKPGSVARYTVFAEAGQHIEVHVSSGETARAFLKITGLNTGKVYLNNLTRPTDWNTDVRLPQNYLIEVISKDEPAEFMLTVRVH